MIPIKIEITRHTYNADRPSVDHTLKAIVASLRRKHNEASPIILYRRCNGRLIFGQPFDDGYAVILRRPSEGGRYPDHRQSYGKGFSTYSLY